MSRKHCRTLVRSRGKRVLNAYNRMVAHFSYAQLTENWREWKYRTISQRQAEQLVSAGEAERITREKDGAVQVVGYKALTPTSWERPSPATLTFSTMCAVAKRSMDVKHPKDFRLTRRERDELVKFDVWALIGDKRAVAVRPRISDAERKRAESLLGIKHPKKTFMDLLHAIVEIGQEERKLAAEA